MKKAMVTGATGFIGKFLVRELMAQGVEVLAVARPHSKNRENLPGAARTVECGLDHYDELPTLVPDRDVEAVFHTAWQGVSDEEARDPDVQLRNIAGTLSLLDAACRMGIGTFVGCGSLQEAELRIVLESDGAAAARYVYGTAKTAAHWMGKAKAGSRGVRFFWPWINTYGEEERSDRLVNTVIRAIYRNESPALSDGDQFYDFVHVRDVARALYWIAERGVDGTNYTIGSGHARPLREFLEVVGRVANEIHGSDAPLGFGRRAGQAVHLPREVFSDEALRRDTGFAPSISFEEGVRRTALWLKDHP